jgi:hypothetical protein
MLIAYEADMSKTRPHVGRVMRGQQDDGAAPTPAHDVCNGHRVVATAILIDV